MREQDRKDLYTFMGETKQAIIDLKASVVEIKDNHLHHVNMKLNGLFFTVIGSVIIAVFTIAYKYLTQ